MKDDLILPEIPVVDQRAKNLIIGMLHKNKDQRLKLTDILEDTWLFPNKIQPSSEE